MDLGLRDRAYVVTGGSRGLGLASAQALVADGARVLVSSRDETAVAAAVAGLGEAATGMAADNGDPDAAGRLVAATIEAFGRIDGALISVGGPPGGTTADVTEQAWRDAFESVFLGALRVAQATSERMTDGGSLAFVLSSSVRSPIPKLAISNGLRPGLAGLVKTLADEWGPAGVRVNGLVPGKIATSRVRENDARLGDPDEVRAATSRTIPLRRYGETEEFGKVAAFVLSPAASYLTGTMITVDGGLIRTW
jgi:3-oxoacyl-[acyl-carrier protein] reductase